MAYDEELQSRRILLFFFFQAEDGIRDLYVTGVQTCALPISHSSRRCTSTWRGRPSGSSGTGRPRSTSATSRPPARSRRSEERRVGKECRSRGARYHEKK